MKKWKLIVPATLGVLAIGSMISLAMAAEPAKHPALDHPEVPDVADELKTAVDQPAADAQTLRQAAEAALEKLPEDHFARAMLKTALAESAVNVSSLRENIGRVYESLTFRPLMEAELPKGFPPFTPVNHIEVKTYPAYRMARATMKEPAEQRGNSAFFSLFAHIQRNAIEMTAPVQVDYDETGEKSREVSMAFLYGDPQLGAAGVDAADAGVEVIDVPEHRVLSIGVRGDMNEKAVETARKSLAGWLEKHRGQFAVDGPLRKMGYNSPFIPNSRRFFEVQIPVREIASTKSPTKQPTDDGRE